MVPNSLVLKPVLTWGTPMENYGKSQHHLPQPARQTAAFWSTPRQSPPGTQGTSWQRGAIINQ